jgi:hypothetical protein
MVLLVCETSDMFVTNGVKDTASHDSLDAVTGQLKSTKLFFSWSFLPLQLFLFG